MSIFDSVLIRKPGRSLFNLSHERKFSCNFGYLYPVLCTECVPGDTFKISTELLVRSAPLIAPVMHRINAKLNYFFIPYRLCWDEWEDFITGINQSTNYVDAAGDDSTDYFVSPVPPYVTISAGSETSLAGQKVLQDGSLADFLGYPTHRPTASLQGSVNVPLLPFYAYHKVWTDWFRNENVEGGHVGPHTSGLHTNGMEYMNLYTRNYEKDYFTSCLPFAQRGDAMPLPISPNGSLSFESSGDATIVRRAGNGNPAANVSSMGSDRDGNLIDTQTTSVGTNVTTFNIFVSKPISPNFMISIER